MSWYRHILQMIEDCRWETPSFPRTIFLTCIKMRMYAHIDTHTHRHTLFLWLLQLQTYSMLTATVTVEEMCGITQPPRLPLIDRVQVHVPSAGLPWVKKSWYDMLWLLIWATHWTEPSSHYNAWQWCPYGVRLGVMGYTQSQWWLLRRPMSKGMAALTSF